MGELQALGLDRASLEVLLFLKATAFGKQRVLVFGHTCFRGLLQTDLDHGSLAESMFELASLPGRIRPHRRHLLLVRLVEQVATSLGTSVPISKTGVLMPQCIDLRRQQTIATAER